VRAELTIECRSDGIAAALESLYGANNPEALAKSALATEAPVAAGAIKYTAVTQGLIVMAEYVGARKVVLYVEPTSGLLRHGAETIWTDIRQRGNLKPKLTRLVINDERANDILASAALGVRGKVLGGDATTPVLTGVVTGAVLVVALLVGNASADFVYGSATALAVAVVYIALIVRALRSKAITWR
jgi:ABC-type microcin C transport system permease subunit YejE